MSNNANNTPNEPYSSKSIKYRFGFIGCFLYNRFKDKSQFQSRGKIFLLFASSFFLVFFLFFNVLNFLMPISHFLFVTLLILLLCMLYGFWASIYFTKES